MASYNVALSIITQPTLIDRVNNVPIWIRATSAASEIPGHRFTFHLYDKDDILISSSKVLADPDGVAEFDAAKILKNYLSHDFQPTITDFAACENSIKEYYVGVTQTYDNMELPGVGAANNGTPALVIGITGSLSSFAIPYLARIVGSEVVYLLLPGITLSNPGPYYIRNIIQTVVDGVNVLSSFQLWTHPTAGAAVTVSSGSLSGTIYIQNEFGDFPDPNSAGAFTSSESYTNDFLAINSAADPYTQLDWNNGTAYVMNTSTDKVLSMYDFSTDIKKTFYGAQETVSFLSGVEDPGLGVAGADWISYYPDGSVADSGSITNSLLYSGSPGAGFTNAEPNMRLDLGVGSDNLSLDSDILTYTVQLKDCNDDPLGALMVFQYEDFCENTDVRIAWKNLLGGFEYASMRIVDKFTNTERSTFRKELRYGYTAQDRGETVYHSQSTSTITLVNKSYLTLTEVPWMRSLFQSSEVYMQTSVGGTWQPMIVETNSSRDMIVRKDRMKEYTVSLRYANRTPGNP